MSRRLGLRSRQVRGVYAGISVVAVITMLAILSALEGRADEHHEKGHHEAIPEQVAPSTHEVVAEHEAVQSGSSAAEEPSHVVLGQHKSGWRVVLERSAFGQAYRAFEEKLRQAAELDQDNEILRKRVAALESENGHLVDASFECREEIRANGLKADSVAEGGVETSRTIASLKTADPDLLKKTPKVIFDAAAEAFAKNDYETAGKAFVYLVDNSEDDAFQDAQTLYLTGVSLYKVGNYKRAVGYLEKAETHAKVEDLSYGPRALGWMALCQKKLGNTRAEKNTIRELIQKYPRSPEARRLNRNA
ncbi:MAG: tetratricopeptide repeat protein [Deltaproteobacteria bacterium]|nr:tetratricopeptide repeat protein [Deltaproteobacteria bacterium]